MAVGPEHPVNDSNFFPPNQPPVIPLEEGKPQFNFADLDRQGFLKHLVVRGYISEFVTPTQKTISKIAKDIRQEGLNLIEENGWELEISNGFVASLFGNTESSRGLTDAIRYGRTLGESFPKVVQPDLVAYVGTFPMYNLDNPKKFTETNAGLSVYAIREIAHRLGFLRRPHDLDLELYNRLPRSQPKLRGFKGLTLTLDTPYIDLGMSIYLQKMAKGELMPVGLGLDLLNK